MQALATHILEHMPNGLLVLGDDGQCLYANESSCHLLGMTSDELLGKTLTQILPKGMSDDEKQDSEYFSTATQQWYEVHSFPTPQGTCISFADITGYKRQQANATFLGDLTETLSYLSSQEAILQTIGERLTQHFHVSSSTVARVHEAADEFTVIYDSQQQHPQRSFEPQRLSDFSNEDFLREMKAGRVIVVHDLLSDPRTATVTEAFTSFNVRSFLLASHKSKEQIDFVIGMQHSEPYTWRRDEIELLQELIARVYPQLERVRAEQGLRESRAEADRQRRFFEKIFDNLSNSVFIWNRQYRYVYINRTLEKLWGIEHGAAVGKTAADLGLEYPPETEKLIKGQVAYVFETGKDVIGEMPYTSPTGVHGYFEYIFSPVFADDGSVELVAGISQDISKRKQMEQALRDSEQRVRAERQRLYDLFMQAPAAIAVLQEPGHVCELVNTLGMQIVGGGHRPIIGKSVRDAVPEVEAQGYLALLDSVYQTGKPFIGTEVPGQFDKNGDGILEQGYFNIVFQPSYNAAGKIDSILAYVNDVTETVLARRRIEESEERLRALADSMPQLVWSASADGAIDFFNERLNEYAEISRNEKGIYDWQAIIHPDDRERTQHIWKDAMRTGNMFENEQRMHLKNGTYRWHLVRGVPLRREDGSIVRWYGTKTDIEQLKQIEQQRIDFLGVVSHELKTPVTSAKAFAEVLENRFRKAGDERTAALLDKMRAQMDKLTRLISDLLDVTKIEAGKLQFNEDLFAFDDMVDDIIEEVQRTTPTHTIERQGRTGATVYGDSERIGQVLTNLLTNGTKYSPNASRVVVTTTSTEGEVTLCVQDFGIGIAQDKLPHVFERFFRETGAREDTFAGLGLGLYVACEIITRQGGKMWVNSEKGQGSTFCFSLPVQHDKKP